MEFDQTPGVQLEADLKLIRQKRNVSIEEIHNRTKIPVEIITQFEQGALTNDPQFNRVYLRAIVRTYADLVDVSPELAAQSLEASMAGRYQGELARKYLDADIPAPAPPVPERPRQAETDEPESREPPSTSVEPPITTMSDHANQPLHEVDVRPPMNWGRVMFILLVAVAVAVLLWVLVNWDFSPETPTDGAAVLEVAEERPDFPPVVLGPVISVTVVAAEAPLGPVRVAVDEGTQNPYWVERGDSISFTGAQRFELTGNLGAARILVEGIEWPTEVLGPRSSLTLTRESVQTYLNAVRRDMSPAR